jgi:hypothetical protein
VELELVGAVAVGRVALEVLGQVDNSDGLKGALLHADTATNAERLANARIIRFHLGHLENKRDSKRGKARAGKAGKKRT